MGHASQLYISNLVMKLRGNRQFWGLDKKILAAGCASLLPRCHRALEVVQCTHAGIESGIALIGSREAVCPRVHREILGTVDSGRPHPARKTLRPDQRLSVVGIRANQNNCSARSALRGTHLNRQGEGNAAHALLHRRRDRSGRCSARTAVYS